MVRNLAVLLSLGAAILFAPNHSNAVTMSWSPVGNPGNAADPTTGYGAVDYSYSIGTYEVTVNQYVAFLNANEPDGYDPLELYRFASPDGPSYEVGVSYNSSAANGSKYSVVAGDGNLPITYVTVQDAMRFANWLDNGQPIFTSDPTRTNNATEHGAYTFINGFTGEPYLYASGRNPGETYYLSSIDEWYKAAYYDPATSSYFLYPTSSNSVPNASAPTSAPNSVNASDVVGAFTDVDAYPGTTSPYGALDMGGNAFNWLEGQYFRGGYYDAGPDQGQSTLQGVSGIDKPDFGPIGFRLVMVPEPSSVLLALAGCFGMVLLRKRLT